MKSVKKILGLVWMLLAPAAIFILAKGAFSHIGQGTKDIHQPVPWIIIISIFTPIAIGLFIFGYYCLKGEYNHLPRNTAELTTDEK